MIDKYPKTEIYGLVSQMRKAAISIPSNIAEGRRRSTKKDYRQFLFNAFGSGAELETQIEISKRLFRNIDYLKVESLLNEVMKMLNVIIQKLSAK